MKFFTFFMLAIFTVVFNLYSEDYTLKNNEKIIVAKLSTDNYAAYIIEVKDIFKPISYDIIYNEQRLSGYKEAGTINILPNKTLVATMKKDSEAKELWSFIYGNRETYFDNIESLLFSKTGNRSIVFGKIGEYGFVFVDGVFQMQYTTLIDATIEGERYAYSFIKDDVYYLNTDGRIEETKGIVTNIIFSKDNSMLAYLLQTDGGTSVVINNNESEVYQSVESLVFAGNNFYAYTAKVIQATNENTNETNSVNLNNYMFQDRDIILKNTNIDNTQNTAVISDSSDKAITVMGSSNSIALLSINEGISNINITNYMPFLTETSNSVLNEFITTTVFLNGEAVAEYATVTNIMFSDNSKSLMFMFNNITNAISTNTNKVANINTLDTNKYSIFHSGNETKEYDKVYLYKYLPNGNFSIAVKDGRTSKVISGGKEIITADSFNDFYYAENTLFVNAVIKGREYIMNQNFQSPAYTKILSFNYIKNKNSFIITAEKSGKYYYYIYSIKFGRGYESEPYEYISDVVIDNDNSVNILGLREKRFYIIKDGLEIKK